MQLLLLGFPPCSLWRAQVNAAAQEIHSLVDAECNLIFGAVVDDGMVDEVSGRARVC